MTRPCQRRKVKRPGSKISRKSSIRKPALGDSTIERHWDVHGTLQENYARLGLADQLNKSIGLRSTRDRLEEWNHRRAEGVRTDDGLLEDFESDPIFEELEGMFAEGDGITRPAVIEEWNARNPQPIAKTCSEYQREYIGKLVVKHGQDFEAMCRDTKLNRQLLSAGQLRKLATKILN